MSKQGKFIVVEGIDGSGKSSLIDYLAVRLGDRCIKTKEPGGGPIGSAVNKILAERDDISPVTELLLYEAARAEHVKRVIKPALNAGKIVLCDRFSGSTKAYQGAGLGISLETIDQLNLLTQDGIKPDLTIWLSVDIETAMGRSKKTDARDKKSFAFYEKVQTCFMGLCYGHFGGYKEKWEKIDANQPFDQMCKTAFDLISSYL